MAGLFISHSSADDQFVRELREALDDHKQEVWIDSRQLRGGDPLSTEIQKAISEASAFAVVVSPEGLQSNWVGKELRRALEVQKQRGKDKFPVVPISLNETKLGVLEEFFDEEPTYITATSAAGGVEVAVHAILVALGKRLPTELPPAAQPKAQLLEELALELTDLKFQENDGIRRATARARLVYEPATFGQEKVYSTQSWRLVAPTGPIEATELTWYLEQYAIWPSGIDVIRDRARRVELSLVTWGKEIHDIAMPAVHTANVMQAWARVDDHAGRRFSVSVDASVEAGASKDEASAAQEAATEILRLPWELMHDVEGFLFQGAKPVRVRRRFPTTKARDVPVVAPPIRILLVSARPEDDACGYIDHRASALPLVSAMESLPGLVKLKALNPATLPALGEELDRARAARKPYHVVHFDGHGIYSKKLGLGGLCFEHPDDINKLDRRRHITVFTQDTTGTGLGALLRDHRIPLVFLEACQSAQAESASESVASEMLKVGVASVVAMTHSVLVETSERFVGAFYKSLAAGQRVGDAMLKGQRRLKDDTRRCRVFGADDLRLEDWFVPVLYQEKDDPQLFRAVPPKQTVEDEGRRLAKRMGELPAVPSTGFVGRSRELLALQRLLLKERYAVVRGQGGEGKTTLAAEFARWMVRSQQVRRTAFVSVESNGNLRAVVDALGRQLAGASFSAAGDLDSAIQQVEHALRERTALLVIDNMESILLPPFMAQETPEALSDDAGEELKTILALCERLMQVGETRLVFTSREALPAPFDASHNRRELHRLDRNDAVKLVERALNSENGGSISKSVDAAPEEIEALVESVDGHARTLAVLAPTLRKNGVDATRASLLSLMAEMEQQFPGSREKSVFASVQLSLDRLSPDNQERARVLGVFHGGCQLNVLRIMMDWEPADVADLATELIATGMATGNRHSHLTLNPALSPYLRRRLDTCEHEKLIARWTEAMLEYSEFLVQQGDTNPEFMRTLTSLELPNLFALLDTVNRAGDAEATIDLATSLYRLLQHAGSPRAIERVTQVRDAAAALKNVSMKAQFQAAQTRIEQQWASGRVHLALQGAQALLQKARVAGDQAYPGADYDLAMAVHFLGRALRAAGSVEQALPLLDEGRRLFEAIAMGQNNQHAQTMARSCINEMGECLLNLGRLKEASEAYEECIRHAERTGNDREVAIYNGQLGTVLTSQRRFPEALLAHSESRKRFTELGEPGTVAISWMWTGLAYQASGELEAAEDAYRESLAISVRLGDTRVQAGTLVNLGNLYAQVDRMEDAAASYRQATDKFVEIGDAAAEGTTRSNLAEALRKIRRLEEARQEALLAIKCKAQFGHASTPWSTWNTLAGIEAEDGNPDAAEEAFGRARACFLAYRRDGGENHDWTGLVASSVAKSLLAGNAAEASEMLQQVAAAFNDGKVHAFIHALECIVAGSRDDHLADDPALDYRAPAEILLLIDMLDSRSSTSSLQT